MKHFIANTSNGKSVHVDLIKSQAAPHIASHPHLLDLVRDLVTSTDAQGELMKLQYDVGRPIGYENVVVTTQTSPIVYGKIINDDLYSRFTRTGKPLQTSFISIVMVLDEEGTYMLTDAWIGTLKPPRPGSQHETAESREFWSNHAFLLDTQPLVRSTRTSTCPY
jgi:hypothetical protein